MTGFWLASYIALWLFVLLQALLLLALIRHIGNLRLWLRQAGVIRDVMPVEEGPPLGEALPELCDLLATSLGATAEMDGQKARLLLFVPAGFFGCDDLLSAVNDFEQEYASDFQTIIISFTPGVAEQFEVARRKGIQAPIILENGWSLASLCNVFTAPYALVIDPQGITRAKLPVSDEKGLHELIEVYRNHSNDISTGGD